MNNKELTHRFHFTLGPVQGFVAQARRTRDFWAGSFLLSYLTAYAMKITEDEEFGGKIISPALEIKENGKTITDPLLARIKSGNGDGPCVATLPNHFEAMVGKDFNGEKIAQSVRDEWKRIADAVWLNDLENIASGKKDLWNEQIMTFWDIVWVISEGEVPAALSMRKNWRSHMPPEALGDKCTMMGEWQELSGFDSPNPKQQEKDFWGKVRNQIDQKLDLREGERLCAIAFVKRRFVHIWQDLNSGWKLPGSVPSTSYMAAVHWLKKLIESKPDSEQVVAFCKHAKESEYLTRICCVSDALKVHTCVPHAIANVDGRLLFDSELEQLSKGKEKKGEISQRKVEKLIRAKKDLLDSAKGFDAQLSPFYAILFMDGDNLGKAIEELGKDGKEKISVALATFTRKVAGIGKQSGTVYRNNGFLIYAGGDDVLAILPLDDAMACAAKLRQDYLDSFKDLKTNGNVSISAAITYAHMKLPLTAILKDTFRLLVDVAKDGTGRDAIACRVWKPGGEQLTWAVPWKEALDGGNLVMDQLSGKFQVDEAGDPGYASKVLYRIRNRMELLGKGFDERDIQSLLEAEYLTSGVLDGMKDEKKHKLAKDRISELLPQCRTFGPNGKATGEYSGNAAIFLRFLAQKGVER